MNLEAMAPDLIVIRHASPGAPHLLAEAPRGRRRSTPATAPTSTRPRRCSTPSPSASTRASSRGLRVAIIGDIEHSRVVRSNIHLLTKMGATVTVGGPRTLMPAEIEAMGVEVAYDARRRHPRRRRRHDAAHPARAAGEAGLPLDPRVLPAFRPHRRAPASERRRMSIVMHPGPMNRGVEISSERRRRPLFGHPGAGHQRRGRPHGRPLPLLAGRTRSEA